MKTNFPLCVSGALGAAGILAASVAAAPRARVVLPHCSATVLKAIPAKEVSLGRRVLMDADWRFQMSQSALLSSPTSITQWRWRLDVATASGLAAADVDTSGNGWKDTTTGTEIFGGREGFAWYRTTLPTLPAPAAGLARYVSFAGVDDDAQVYLNGKLLKEHSGWNDQFEVALDEAWRADGPNVLAVRVENTGGGGGITGGVTLGYGPRTVTGTSLEAQPNFNDRAWRTLHLPHDFVVEGTFTPQGDAGHGSLLPGSAWYRKTFTLPASDKGKSAWLDFDGVFHSADVYLNGKLLGHHVDGYAPFRFDITQAANYGGPNALAVYVNARSPEGWWYEGGGIYRHVWLNVAAPLHVAPWGVFVSSQMPEPTMVNGTMRAPSATIRVKTTLANDGAANSQCTLVSRLVSPTGSVIAAISSPATSGGKSSSDFTQTLVIPQPQLWSIEKPNLYTVQTVVQRGKQVLDTKATPFGIRTIRFDANQGFFLNGQPVKIKGTCNHQDFAGVGVALPDSLFAWRISKLKEMGSNAYRTSHNPVAQELLDECDRQGMLVMDETRHLGDATGAKSPSGTGYSDLSDLKAMVARDRNHPSIIMWSMANEEGLQGSEEGGRIFKAMKDATDALDGTRPTTAAMNGGWGGGISNVQDVQGFNYAIGAYDGYHARFPQVAVYGSETASAVQTRGIYANDPVKGYVSNYDKPGGGWANSTQDAWKAIATRPWMAGGFVWTGFDYKGEPTPYGWPCINSHFGILDMCGFPKDPYYYYQAWWGDKPLVHLFPHWNWAGKEGQTLDVWAYGNTATVELVLNGKSLGTKPMPPYEHIAWPVPYQPGVLEARGYDAGGKLIASDKVETTGAPVALRIVDERRHTLKPDGEDATVVAVQVVDAQGRVVPTADNLVTFKITGAAHIAGVGNGDPSSHEPDKASQRHAFNGLCMAIVQANEKAGVATLTIASPGLKSATLQVKSGR